MNFIKNFILRFFAIIGVLTAIIIICTVIIIKSLADMKKDVKERTVLHLKTSMISGDVVTEGGFFAFDSYLSQNISLIDTLLLIRKASKDEKVVGIMADISSFNLSYAQIEELRNELINFSKTGKPIYVWTDTFGEIIGGTKSYYLASAFDKIYMQPSGSVGFTGISTNSMFFKNTLKKLDMEPIGSRRKEYKNYWNMFSEEKYTDEHKEASQSLIDSIFSKIKSDISKSRNIPVKKLQEITDSFPLTSDEALKNGFIDEIIFKDKAVEKLKNAVDFKSFVSLSSYAKMTTDNFDFSEKSAVALIEMPGSVHRGSSEFGATGHPTSTGSSTMVALLSEAWKDDKVKGIIIRVNSPGGSVIASETIWNKIREMVKENKKPVYVSMGTVAASGGYYISMPAEKIFADHTTITGSIGVVIGKIYMREFYKKLGITFDSVSTGKNNDMFSPITKITEEQNEYVEKSLDRIYDEFVSRAAEGRKIKPEELEKYAKGRVWSGTLAKEKNLVDENGGFMDVFDSIKKKIKFEGDIAVTKYPRPEKMWEMIFTDYEDDQYSGFFGWLRAVLHKIDVLFSTVNEIKRDLDSDEIIKADESLEIH